MPTVFQVFVASMITALCTGLGALPFLFVKNINRQILGVGNAVAAGLMLGASIGLIVEGAEFSAFRMTIGLALGLFLIVLARQLLGGETEHDHDEHADGTSEQSQRHSHGHGLDFGDLVGNADALKMLMIVGVMTAHSFAEGIGVGVAFGGGESFGRMITSAIAIHNIPEGLAISLVLIPRGVSTMRAAAWSVFSSLPQPIMAVISFLFVLVFEPFLPIGLGLAAGAMIWMVFTELLPEAEEEIADPVAAAVMGLATVAMMAFQVWVS